MSYTSKNPNFTTATTTSTTNLGTTTTTANTPIVTVGSTAINSVDAILSIRRTGSGGNGSQLWFNGDGTNQPFAKFINANEYAMEQHVYNSTYGGERTFIRTDFTTSTLPNITLFDGAAAGSVHLDINANTAGGYSREIRFLNNGTLYSRIYSPNDTSLAFECNNVTTMQLGEGGNGIVQFNNIGTTASAANAFLNSGSNNSLLRSTSSIKYKTDVQDLKTSDVMYSLRPVIYKSLAEQDDKNKTHLGLIAEEVDKVEPMLVHYDKGVPDGVQYERLTVLLLAEVQKLRKELDTLKAKMPA